MKKYLLILISISLLAIILNAKTNTSVIFGTPEGNETNEYGDKIMDQNVTITTKNFKINNFWGKFSDTAQDQSTFTDIATAAKVKLTIENSFTCKDGGLPEEGCSGQKPFLINQGTLDNDELKRDAMGQVFSDTDEYRIPFDSAQNYKPGNKDAFYALDVFRDDKYYQGQNDGTSDYNQEKPKTFFGYMVKLIKTYFSPQNDTTVINALTASQVKARNRYMANIVFGLQQDYRIKEGSTINTDPNNINQASTTKQPSLLDYNALMINGMTGCDGIFFTFNPNSARCKLQNFLGMSRWMPFFGNGVSIFGKDINNSNILSDSVLEDTETTLLTLASKLDDTKYVQQKINPNNNTTFLGEVFKPMTYMMSSISRFFFGSTPKNLTEMVAANFNFLNPMPLTFIETDGAQAVGFVYFKLLGLESVYGTEVQECTIKKPWKSELTFTEGGSKTLTFKDKCISVLGLDLDGGTCMVFYNDTEPYIPKEQLSSKTYARSYSIVEYTMSNQDVLDWCQRNYSKSTHSILRRIATKIKSFWKNFFGSTKILSKEQAIDLLFEGEGWTIHSYKEKVHKGLILHLKKIDIGHINATTPGTTTKFKIMNITRGN